MGVFDLFGFSPFNKNRPMIKLMDFLNNPSGKSSSMFAKREEIKKNLNFRYNKLLSKHKSFNFNIIEEDEHYYFLFKIPSESFDELFYDVVLEFVPDDEDVKKLNSINEYSMNFFSNSPHMLFTYTYVLKENNLIIEFLEDLEKYSKTALKERPKVRNPIEMFGFEKSCYFAALFIYMNKFNRKNEIAKKLLKLSKLSKEKLYKTIKSQEQKLFEYNNLKKQKQNEKRINRLKNKASKPIDKITYSSKKSSEAKKEKLGINNKKINKPINKKINKPINRRKV